MQLLALPLILAVVLTGCASTPPPPASCEPGDDWRMINPAHHYDDAEKTGAL